MGQQIKAAGYIRVSSAQQVEGESLTTQRKEIEQHCEQNDYKLIEIYEDKGISGGTVKDRKGLLEALHDARNGKFDLLIIRDLTRFGRNARELLNNRKLLKDHGVELCFIKDNIDTSTDTGELLFQLLSIIAEFETKMIKERMLDNKIAKAKRGVPPGRLPFGRTFDYDKEEWGVDQNAKDGIKWAADQFLSGKKSMQEISLILQNRWDLPASYSHLLNVLKKDCGDTWTVEFEELDEPIPYTVPRLLDDNTIKKVTDRLEHNRTNNRTDVNNKYVLTGFIRCEHCKKSLSGQTQQEKYKYYVHPSKKDETCKEFSTIPLPAIERAVFQTIFENIYDVPSFEEAIKDSLPDQQLIDDLNQTIEKGEEDLKKVNKELKKLVDAVLNGTLEEDTIKEKEQELKKTKEQLVNEIEDAQNRLDNLPDIEEVKKEANQIRKMLKRKYQSEEHLQNMSYEDKKQLLHFLFDGSDEKGTRYGIYVEKRGRGKSAEIDYFMYGRLTGLRTIKGDDIDYFPEDEKDKSSHKKSDYKTNSFSSLKK